MPEGSEQGRTSTGWVPIPDPTILTTEAVTRVTEQFQRDISQLRELHDKDLAALHELLSARMTTSEQDRDTLRTRIRELESAYQADMTRFHAEVESRDKTGRELIEQRIDGMDQAIAVATRERDRFVGVLIDKHEAHFRDEREFIMSQIEIISTRMTEKFIAIDGQFAASKTAVDAALSAAKEAVAEQNKANSAAIKVSEGNTKEQLTSLGQVSSANFKAMEDKITDARDRLTVMESLTRGIKEAGGETRQQKTLVNNNAILGVMTLSMIISVVAIVVSILVHVH